MSCVWQRNDLVCKCPQILNGGVHATSSIPGFCKEGGLLDEGGEPWFLHGRSREISCSPAYDAWRRVNQRPVGPLWWSKQPRDVLLQSLTLPKQPQATCLLCRYLACAVRAQGARTKKERATPCIRDSMMIMHITSYQCRRLGSREACEARIWQLLL